MSLSKKQLQDVCLMSYVAGATMCRYVKQDDRDGSKFYCLKMRAAEKKAIDQKVSDFVKHCQQQGIDPNDQRVPLGDNCSGFPLLKYVEQGYDKP